VVENNYAEQQYSHPKALIAQCLLKPRGPAADVYILHIYSAIEGTGFTNERISY